MQVNISEVQYTYTKTLTKFTMTQKAYFHAPKCTSKSDHIWDRNWNYMDTDPDFS